MGTQKKETRSTTKNRVVVEFVEEWFEDDKISSMHRYWADKERSIEDEDASRIRELLYWYGITYEYEVNWARISIPSDCIRRQYKFPNDLWNHHNQQNLKKLEICWCPHSTIPSEIGKLTRLVQLIIDRCDFNELPSSIGNLKALEKLKISRCYDLYRLPQEVGNLTGLTELILDRCDHFSTLPPSIGRLGSMQKLKICRCDKLQRVPREIGNMTSLVDLTLEFNPMLEAIPVEIGQLGKLESIRLYFDDDLMVPAEVFSIGSLISLNITYCKGIGEFPIKCTQQAGAHRLTEIYLYGLLSLSLPHYFGKMVPNLKKLTISHCPNITSLPQSSICDLQNLQQLVIWFCPSIKSLPDFDGLRSLQNLEIIDSCDKFNIPKWLNQKNPSSLPRRIRGLVVVHHYLKPTTAFSDSSTLLSCIRNILESNYELLSIAIGNEVFIRKPLPIYETYLLLLNRSGRVLLRRQEGCNVKPISPSMWPEVLSRVHKVVHQEQYSPIGHDTRRRELEASIIFFLLQGPALMSRVSADVYYTTTTKLSSEVCILATSGKFKGGLNCNKHSVLGRYLSKLAMFMFCVIVATAVLADPCLIFHSLLDIQQSKINLGGEKRNKPLWLRLQQTSSTYLSNRRKLPKFFLRKGENKIA